MDPLALILMIVCVGSSFVGIYYMFIRPYREALAKQREGMERLKREVDLKNTLNVRRVVLAKKNCRSRLRGSRSTLKSQQEFFLLFKDEFGREIPLSVEEEIYLSVEEGDSGLLALSDGEFYSFALDE